MFKRTMWKDHVPGVQEGTDLNAANLNNLEEGVTDAAALAAFYASQQNAGGNLPYREDLSSGGYCIDVPVCEDGHYMYSEKEWAVKPLDNGGDEVRTTDRFGGYTVYELDIINFEGSDENSALCSLNIDDNKLSSGKKFFLVGIEGTYCRTESGFDVWTPINDSVFTATVRKYNEYEDIMPSICVETSNGPVPPFVIRVRYIYK